MFSSPFGRIYYSKNLIYPSISFSVLKVIHSSMLYFAIEQKLKSKLLNIYLDALMIYINS